MKQSPDAAGGERGIYAASRSELKSGPELKGEVAPDCAANWHKGRVSMLPYRAVAALLFVAALAVSALFISHPRQTSPQPETQAAAASAPDLKTPPAPVPRPHREALAQSPPRAAVAGAQFPAPQDETRSPRQLVGDLTRLSAMAGPITPEQAAQFKQDLAELVRGGSASVPAIQELLAKNQDFRYGELSGGEQLEYSSLRAALIDTLKQIGGPEAHTALLQTFQTTAVPGELLELSKNLDQQAPGQYREQFLIAAQETLNMAAANQIGTNVELGPAFRMLQNYGDVAQGGIADSARTDPQNFLSAVTLASLPDGQGLDGLMQMADNPNPTAAGKAIATEMIGQLAGQYSDAFDALLQLARSGRISNGVWVQLAPILAGDAYQLGSPQGQNASSVAQRSADQAYQIVDSATTPDEINHRMAMIDQFLSVVPGDSAAANALRHQQALLAGKLAK
ncbi:MAG: hypothetical protein C5B50_09075 [Verrucomicrobia bacterium]|nr:MAG: hypothetical protein C5B50_09075 [Verrucomicrobiota bacterium]